MNHLYVLKRQGRFGPAFYIMICTHQYIVYVIQQAKQMTTTANGSLGSRFRAYVYSMKSSIDSDNQN